ncbi:MAG: helix-turn-helix domain-containing protein [Akkermansiaceae bacterium]|nr:helix-turn-helix domain-containing protein [Akkermansiaceae bacterium]
MGMKIQDLSDIGSIIRQQRKAAGLSIETLASMLACSPRLLGELERGARNVSFIIVLKTCAMLGIELFAKCRGDHKP